MQIKLADGSVIEGTPEQVQEFMTQMGLKVSGPEPTKDIVAPEPIPVGPMYFSESKGESVPISSMAIPWLRNAIQKKLRKWAEGLIDAEEVVFEDFLVDGIVNLDDEAENLIEEYLSRLDSKDE